MKNLTLPIFITVLIACNQGSRDVRDYYYPVLDLQGGKVYVYDLPEGDSSSKEYWYYRGFVRDSGIFLASTNYDEHFEIRQITREQFVSSGALMRDYFLYEVDTSRNTLTKVPASIESASVFPFRVSDSLGVFLYKMTYSPPSTRHAQIYIIRNRRYLGNGPDFELDGRRYPTVRFGVREAIGYEKEGSAEVEGTGEELYAKDLGLVYWRKNYGGAGGFEKAYELKEIIGMEELERRAASYLGTSDSLPAAQ